MAAALISSLTETCAALEDVAAIELNLSCPTVEEAAEFLFDHGIPAYPYTTETPVMVLGAKYHWARGAGLVK